jgi:5-formyltetrahydrofolate cyclo-ligase
MKAALRRRARAARAAFVSSLSPAVRRAMEAAVANRVAPCLVGHQILASYAAIGTEVDPATIEAGWKGSLAFPRLGPNGMEFRTADWTGLVPGAHGIPAPPEDAPLVQPDAVLVPLLLFDSAGNRLGQGGGHYDRMLAHLRKNGPILAIGIGWDMQEEARLPTEPWDAPLDLVATPTRLLAPRR